MATEKDNILKEIIWLRLSQIYINESYKAGQFKIPVHLALGHESIAVAVDHTMEKEDSLFLTHRNIHYNLARLKSVKEDIEEYLLKDSGLGGSFLGSMNLHNLEKNIIYTSSILGNNLCVGSGYAFGNKVKDISGVTFIVTGDGAIEEGAFYESLLFLCSNNLPSIIIIENNEWSLGTKINERRGSIDLKNLSDSLGASYFLLKGNDPFDYLNQLKSYREIAFNQSIPVLVEVELTTLGHWILQNEENPNGKFINYHAGPAPNVNLTGDYPILDESSNDPLFVLKDYMGIEELLKISVDEILAIKEEFK